MSRLALLRLATVVLVLIGGVLVWFSWQVRLAQDEAARAIHAPPPSDSTIGRAFQDDGHGNGHAPEGGAAPGASAGMAAVPPGGNVYAQGGAWRDQDGQPLALSALAGKPAVFTFIYTTCDDACPLIVQSLQAGLARAPAELRERAQWILISFDPETDRPEVLRQYRERMGLKEPNWRLITADDPAVKAVAEMAGFRYARVGKHFSHNAVIAVADAKGEMVGWFADERITDAETLGRGLTQALGM